MVLSHSFSDILFHFEAVSVFILCATLLTARKWDSAIKGALGGYVDLHSNPGSAKYQLFDG